MEGKEIDIDSKTITWGCMIRTRLIDKVAVAHADPTTFNFFRPVTMMVSQLIIS